MATIIYWFRNDLRLNDNPAFAQACSHGDHLLPIYLHQKTLEAATPWGFPRVASHRRNFLQESLRDLSDQLKNIGSILVELSGDPEEVFPLLGRQFEANIIYCEHIEVPEELEQVATLKKLGFDVRAHWQSSMLDIKSLPFDLQQMPKIFTPFRQQIEQKGIRYGNPLETSISIPPLPMQVITSSQERVRPTANSGSAFKGGEAAALAHITQYFERLLPDTYKLTRNQLIGLDYSSKFSIWLAQGNSSARAIAKKLDVYEGQHGKNDGTYWLWFELLWRDYFRFLHFKYGKKLYHSKGLSDKPVNPFDLEKFHQWSTGETGERLVDAGMRELQLTGYLSNRMRQIVASYWIYDMKGDWQAGAAWFESQLIDYDVYSNQGNWLYIAGCGTDPRGGRAFNIKKQAEDHDPNGDYQKMWLS
jgi:deoxyribodipyrimidine photo-lyase